MSIKRVLDFSTKQRQAIRVIYGVEHPNENNGRMKVLNIYKLHIYRVLTRFPGNISSYPTGFSQSNFVEGNILSNHTNLLSHFEVQGSGIGFFKSRTKLMALKIQ